MAVLVQQPSTTALTRRTRLLGGEATPRPVKLGRQAHPDVDTCPLDPAASGQIVRQRSLPAVRRCNCPAQSGEPRPANIQPQLRLHARSSDCASAGLLSSAQISSESTPAILPTAS